MPLIAEASNRVNGLIGALADANTKLRDHLDRVLGVDPPVPSPTGSKSPPSSQGANLINEIESLGNIISETHRQAERLGAI